MDDFTTRARDINRRMLAAKRARDAQFITLIAFHLLVIVGGAAALVHLEGHYERQDKIEQENIAWR